MKRRGELTMKRGIVVPVSQTLSFTGLTDWSIDQLA